MNNLVLRKFMVVEIQFILSVYAVVRRINNGGSITDICYINVIKAFDKVNHCALYRIKLTRRGIPVGSIGKLVIKMFCVTEVVILLVIILFSVSFGVRQGFVLSPVLFAVYADHICNCPMLFWP